MRLNNLNSAKFDWDDITLVPAILSDVDSRSQVSILNDDGKLPLFVAPMDTVIDSNNAQQFYDSGLNITLPRNVKFGDVGTSDEMFFSYGLDELMEMEERGDHLPKKVLIDIANGHMRKLYNFSKKLKEKYGDDLILMVGNIANPETYRMFCNIGVDFCRVGIGGGSGCTTSTNSGIHYPMGSLIVECATIGKQFNNPTKIIADGGFKKFSDIIKALALGADFVMIGGLLAKTGESCGQKYYKLKADGSYIKVQDFIDMFGNAGSSVSGNKCPLETTNGKLYNRYRGMSTKEVQRDWNRTTLKTSEGIAFYTECEYTLNGWLENMSDYLKSAISYTGSFNLKDFKKANYILITDNAFRRFNK